jgi:hypothetical protein
MDRLMTKIKMPISQIKSFATITNKLEANVKDWEVLLKAKMNVNIEFFLKKLNGNLKASRNCVIITNVKFKVKITELLKFFIVVIPIMVC